MYIGIGNPGPYPGSKGLPWGSGRPGRDLYTDSLVKLDSRTGKVEWYYQQTPHDLYDWDLQDPPILTPGPHGPLVIAAGKSGTVVALDAETGKPLWSQDVGRHNGHGRDDSFADRREYDRLKTPETVYPGALGGVIAPAATDGSTLVVPIVDHSATYSSEALLSESSTATGEVTALNVRDGSVLWTRALKAPAFGAVTIVNDIALLSSFDGTLHAFAVEDGREVWSSSLPAGSNTGVTVSGDTVLAPAGIATSSGQTPALAAFRLP
jgi:glucose dehydrogenase